MVVVAAVVVPIAYANLAQTAVKANPKIKEIEPSATDTYFAWTRNSLAHPNHLDAYAQPFGQAPFKVKCRGDAGLLRWDRRHHAGLRADEERERRSTAV
jgi:hypothetical protein